MNYNRTTVFIQPDSDEAILSDAVVKASDLLELEPKVLGIVLGISESSVFRLKSQDRFVKLGSKEDELARLFLRLFRSLQELFGDSDYNKKEWLNSHNEYLEGRPIELIQRVEGLSDAVHYLDSMRAKV